MKIGRSVSSAVAAHAALDTGVHGVGASTILSAADIATLIVTHSDLVTGIHGYEMVRKAADKTLNNVAVLENDDHLLMALLANEVWQIDIFILCMGDAAADIQFGFSYPVGCGIYWGSEGAGATFDNRTWGYQTLAEDGRLAAEVDTRQGGINAAAMTGVKLSLIVINGANAGNINLQWAQVAAQVADTTVFENSCIIAHQLL